MGSPNGGIVGVINPTSFGKCTVTSQTASGTLTTQPGTRIVDYLVVAGGGGGAPSIIMPPVPTNDRLSRGDRLSAMGY